MKTIRDLRGSPSFLQNQKAGLRILIQTITDFAGFVFLITSATRASFNVLRFIVITSNVFASITATVFLVSFAVFLTVCPVLDKSGFGIFLLFPC